MGMRCVRAMAMTALVMAAAPQVQGLQRAALCLPAAVRQGDLAARADARMHARWPAHSRDRARVGGTHRKASCQPRKALRCTPHTGNALECTAYKSTVLAKGWQFGSLQRAERARHACLPSSMARRWMPPSLLPHVTPPLRSSWCAWATRPPPRSTRACWTIRASSRCARAGQHAGQRAAPPPHDQAIQRTHAARWWWLLQQ